jgi:hypothetical protein
MQKELVLVTSDLSYIYADSLKRRFEQDLTDAAQAARISEQELQWLRLLVDDTSAAQSVAVRPRVDRIVADDGSPVGAELAAALLFSDAQPRLFLHTLAFGFERFDTRQHMLDSLNERFLRSAGGPIPLDATLVQGDLFEQRMLAIMDQKAQCLDDLGKQLERLPTLQQAVGRTLQQKVDTLVTDSSVNVVNHLVQIIRPSADETLAPVVGSQSLADAALDSYAGSPLPQGLLRQFLDAQGRILAGDKPGLYLQAFAAMGESLKETYESLLDDYWGTPFSQGRTPRDLAVQTFTEAFRDEVLTEQARAVFTEVEYQQLRLLLGDGVGAANSAILLYRLSAYTGTLEPVKLAGVFLIDLAVARYPGLILYSPSQGLRRFSQLTDVAEYFATASGRIELLSCISSNDHGLLGGSQPLNLRIDVIDQSLFDDRIDSIIAFQKRNVAFLLSTPGIGRDMLVVGADDALDVRQLIDRRLVASSRPGRWGLDVEQRQPVPVLAHDHPIARPAVADLAQALAFWVGYLRTLQSQIDGMGATYPGLETCARSMLNRSLAMLGSLARDAEALWVHEPEQAPVNLVTFFMEVVTGRRIQAHLRSHVYWVSTDGRRRQWVRAFSATLLNSLLKRAKAGFSQTYDEQIRLSRTAPLRRAQVQFIPTQISARIRERLLWVHLDTARRIGNIGSTTLAMFKQVLGRPTFSLRSAFGDEITEVYSLSVVYEAGRPAALMTNVFVMQQPVLSGTKLAMWSPLKGLSEHDSLQHLELYLGARLAYPESRATWLDLFNERDKEVLDARLRQPDAHRLTISLQRIDGHFIDALQAAEQERQCTAVRNAYKAAVQWRTQAGLTGRLIQSTEAEDRSRLALDSLGRTLDVALFMARAPDWILRAPPTELTTLHQLLARFLAIYDSQRSFAFDIPNLQQFARARIQTQLNVDFPGKNLDPDKITVKLTRYTAAPGGIGNIPSSMPAATTVTTGSLTWFAINRLSGFQDASLSATSSNPVHSAEVLEPLYLRNLVRTLDIGNQYRLLLQEKFNEHDPDYFKRLRYYVEQIPPLLLLTAFQYKLENKLSDTAFSYIQNIFNMPDGLARLPVDGHDITLSPLQLIAGEGRTADAVRGVYLIVPRKTGEGPWVVYAIFDENIDFKEYANEAAFLQDLHDSSILQTFILERLDPAVRPIYENGGFVEPHFAWNTESFSDFPPRTPAPVTVKVEPVDSNLLHYLMRGTLEILQMTARQLSVTTAESDKQASRFLMTLGVEQLLGLLPGRLGALVGLWQSQSLLQASAYAAGQGLWGKALSEFVAGLSIWISARRAPEEIALDVVPINRETAGVAIEAEPVPEFSWGNSTRPPQLQRRLQAFEVTNVSLSSLQKDPLFNVYQDSKTLKRFAAVGGKVYQVRFSPDGWRIVESEIDGPFIRLNDHKQWELNLAGGLKGGGGIVTKVAQTLVDVSVQDIFIVEAAGLADIRLNYRDRARRIGEAHLQAKVYAQTALRNLHPAIEGGPVTAESTRIIADFFGVQAPDELLLAEIRRSITELLNALLDPSLSPYSSSRFVVGTNRQGHEGVSAFTYPRDPKKRIYLTERFFSPRSFRLKRPGVGQVTFNQEAHYRATTLLHELSHLSGDTHDIAYVEAASPYLNLLEDSGAYRAQLKQVQESYQQRSLSHLTPRDELFTDTSAGEFRDLKNSDGSGKQAVLRITGKRTLDEARDVFLNNAEKRREVILSNADSVALLITLLGRRLFTVPD